MDAEEIAATYAEELGWGSDRLLAWAASRLAVPKAAPADSFVLHASLELMARAELLALVPEELADRARLRIVWLVHTYAAAGAPVTAPVPVTPSGMEEAIDGLVVALGAGALDQVDAMAIWLGEHATPQDFRRLGPAIAPSLAAAAHAPIGLHLLGRSPHIGGSVLRGCFRDLARNPEWQVPTDGLAIGERPLEAALLEAPLLGPGPSPFIYPIVCRGADAAGHLLRDVSDDPVAAYRAIARVAAWSMLQEGDDFVPYGWTHTLTIPQAVLSLGIDPRLAVAVAGSQVVGFRASMGGVALDPERAVPPVPERTASELIAWAALHHDAHVVKYVLATRDAAAVDPEGRALYLAAALRLAAWWRDQGDDGFFDATSAGTG